MGGGISPVMEALLKGRTCLSLPVWEEISWVSDILSGLRTSTPPCGSDLIIILQTENLPARVTYDLCCKGWLCVIYCVHSECVNDILTAFNASQDIMQWENELLSIE